MTETPALVFKSIAPDRIKASATEREKVYSDFQASVDVLSVELGGREITGIRFFAGGFALTAYQMRDVNDLLPGWRRDGSSMRAVPAKRTPEGKDWANRLAAVKLPDREVPGFPARMRCDGFALYPQLEEVGDDYFMTISMAPYDQYLSAIDATLWARARLSDYFLAREAVEASEEVGS